MIGLLLGLISLLFVDVAYGQITNCSVGPMRFPSDMNECNNLSLACSINANCPAGFKCGPAYTPTAVACDVDGDCSSGFHCSKTLTPTPTPKL
jgi:hypothetical protein